MKEVESYFRCVHGVERGIFWLIEKENSDWLGAYQFSGKSNYVPEGLKRCELMYGPDKLSDWEIEEIRWNRLITLTPGGNNVSYDELNELLNLWNKGSVSSPNFATKCEMSKHVMALRKCSYETFGMKRRRPGMYGSSQVHANERMIDIFERAEIFQVYGDGARKIDPGFFLEFCFKAGGCRYRQR
jgi:hypothetical protein